MIYFTHNPLWYIGQSVTILTMHLRATESCTFARNFLRAFIRDWSSHVLFICQSSSMALVRWRTYVAKFAKGRLQTSRPRHLITHGIDGQSITWSMMPVSGTSQADIPSTEIARKLPTELTCSIVTVVARVLTIVRRPKAIMGRV